jgi:hypothetical protein
MAAPETNKVFLKTMLFYKLMIFGTINSTLFCLIFDEKTGKFKYIQL